MIITINAYKKIFENVVSYTFSIIHKNDGITSPYGKESDLSINAAIEELIYYDIISSNYTEEKLNDLLNNLELNKSFTFGSRWSEIIVTKNKA